MSGVAPSKDEWDVLHEIARFLNQFLTKGDRPRYGYIDRLANPYQPKVIEVTLQEALREARSADYWVPSADVIRKFIELCNKDLSYATITSALALAFQRKEKEEKGKEEV